MKYSLKFFVPSLLVTLSLIQSGYIFYDSTEKENKRIDTSATQELNAYMSQLQGIVEFLYRSSNEDQLDTVIGSLGSDQYLTTALLLDENDRVSRSTRLADMGKPVSDVLRNEQQRSHKHTLMDQAAQIRARLYGVSRLSENGNFIQGIYPIIIDAEEGELRPSKIGLLFMERDLGAIKRTALEARQHSTLKTVIFLIFVALSIGIILHFLVTRKVESLLHVTQQFGKGNYSIRTELNGKDDISRLAQSFDHMAGKVEDSQGRLEKQTQRITLLMNSTAEAIYGVDLNGVCTFINPACMKLLGYTSERQVIGKNTHDMFHHSDARLDPREWYSNPIFQVRRNGEVFHSDEELIWRLDGSYFPAEVWSHPIIVEDETVGLMITFIDITERKRAEKTKNEFISTVSHELRTPLTSILGSLQLIKSGQVGSYEPALESLLEISVNNSQRLLLLINDLLDFEKIANGKMTYTKVPTNAQQLLSQAIQSNEGYASRYDVKLVNKCDLSNITLFVDGQRFIQVISNLLSNAIKFSSSKKQVKIFATLEKNRVCIGVKDYGHGIPAAFHKKIFERFSQADSSDTRQAGGTGLGLAISKSIVEAHQGNIWFETAENKGTTFYVSLPVHETTTKNTPKEQRVEVAL